MATKRKTASKKTATRTKSKETARTSVKSKQIADSAPPSKPRAAVSSSDRAAVASRPEIDGYGIPKSKTGMLPWSHVSERMAAALHYWVSTVSPDGRPHATPVDGLWLDGRLYFGGSPQTRRQRNIAANSAVCIHLESGSDVVIIQGDAIELRGVDRELSERLAKASVDKYGYGPPPDAYRTSSVCVLRPRVAFAWKQFPQDATRFRFAAS